MAVALFALLSLSLFMLGANILLGEWPTVASTILGTQFLSTHIILGLLGSLLALFSVVITMFYFIGTGSAVKEGVQDYELDQRYYQMTLKYKKKFFPVMTLSLIVYIALPAVGAAVTVDYLGPGLHRMVAYLTFVTHAYITYKGWEFIFENDRVVATVDRLIRESKENDDE